MLTKKKKAALSTVRTLKTEVVLIHCQLDQMLFYTNSSMKLTTGEVVANILSVWIKQNILHDINML